MLTEFQGHSKADIEWEVRKDERDWDIKVDDMRSSNFKNVLRS